MADYKKEIVWYFKTNSIVCLFQAFCIPILQIVQETLRDQREGKGTTQTRAPKPGSGKVISVSTWSCWEIDVQDISEAS